MRVLVQASVPTDKGNEIVRDGTVEKVIQETTERWHPEAMYFCPVEGKRGMFMVVDFTDASDIPVFSEPLYQRLSAELNFIPVMNGEELSKAFGRLAEQ